MIPIQSSTRSTIEEKRDRDIASCAARNASRHDMAPIAAPRRTPAGMMRTWALFVVAVALEFAAASIPTRQLSGGGQLPMLMMGGSNVTGWFQLAGKGAAIQTFFGPESAPVVKGQ
eukprot:COSAG05_NODE_1581_length_4493_cov_5.173191_5_plen_116_part_00